MTFFIQRFCIVEAVKLKLPREMAIKIKGLPSFCLRLRFPTEQQLLCSNRLGATRSNLLL